LTANEALSHPFFESVRNKKIWIIFKYYSKWFLICSINN
jgi:hypothetical protein